MLSDNIKIYDNIKLIGKVKYVVKFRIIAKWWVLLNPVKNIKGKIIKNNSYMSHSEYVPKTSLC